MKLLSSLVATLAITALAPFVHAEIALIPQPVSIKKSSEKLIPFNATFSIACKDPKLANISSRTLSLWTGLKLETGAAPATSGPSILIDSASTDEGIVALGKEGYVLEIAANGATTIRSCAPNGAFYGVQTLVQLLEKNKNGEWSLPVVKIEDKPRFSWRGIMLDPCRHFFPKENVKRLIDLMAMHKQNTLHWHLTDDQGWRIEIKKYPKLTSVGGFRSESTIAGNRHKGDGKRYGGFYTQEDIKEVVAYAAERYITVVPEIEIPGHSAAALTAYPEFGNTDIPNYNPQVVTRWGVFDYIYGPQEETFKFLEDVIDEVCELFPSEYIHVGGDEAPKTQWNQSPRAKELMKKENLKNGHDLQSWFIRRVEKHINAKGRKLIGWDEIQEGGLSPTATMMVWRDWKYATQALNQGNKIVMVPTSHCYLDYGQGPTPGGVQFEVIGGKVPLEKVYSLEPVPEGTSPEREKQILGCQANLWSEYLLAWPKVEYQLYPRAIAMAETGWTPKAGKNWESFVHRLESAHFQRLDFLKVNYRKPDGTPAQPEQPMM
ncbi:MAG: beta-N-acetylhexosaminidase [Puniceicoccales bacterium]|nr:beta-N-acetylhexosaminidase [Puniceicoccales bacterium]